MKTSALLFTGFLAASLGSAAPAQTPAPTPAPAPVQAPAPAPPVAAPAAAPVPKAPTMTLDSKILGEETRRINVYTPPGYDSGTGSFPVLYMPDGGWEEDFQHVTETVASLIAKGEMRPVLVVGIENTERRRDLSGPTSNEEDKKMAARVGGSAAFRAFLRDELIPEIQRRYRTTSERAIVGESLAGLFVVETLFLEPDLFDTYIALSPSLWWNDSKMALGARDWLKAHPDLQKTFYLTRAGDDIIEGIEALAAALRELAPPSLHWTYEPRPEEHHSTIFRASEAAAYRKVLGPKAEEKAKP